MLLHPEEETALGLPVVEDDGAKNDETNENVVPCTSKTATDVLDDVDEDLQVQPAVGLRFKELSPLPGPLKLKKSARQQHSSIFTLTPNKEVLEKAAEFRKAKLKKKEEKERALSLGKSKLKPKGKSKFRRFASKIRPQQSEKKKCHRNISFESSSDDDLDLSLIHI